jgi:hypothetical protein
MCRNRTVSRYIRARSTFYTSFYHKRAILRTIAGAAAERWALDKRIYIYIYVFYIIIIIILRSSYVYSSGSSARGILYAPYI